TLLTSVVPCARDIRRTYGTYPCIALFRRNFARTGSVSAAVPRHSRYAGAVALATASVLLLWFRRSSGVRGAGASQRNRHRTAAARPRLSGSPTASSRSFRLAQVSPQVLKCSATVPPQPRIGFGTRVVAGHGFRIKGGRGFWLKLKSLMMLPARFSRTSGRES